MLLLDTPVQHCPPPWVATGTHACHRPTHRVAQHVVLSSFSFLFVNNVDLGFGMRGFWFCFLSHVLTWYLRASVGGYESPLANLERLPLTIVFVA